VRRAPLLALAFLLAACGLNDSPARTERFPLRITTAQGSASLQVEIADTPDERAEGLMGRVSLGADAGMAFLWDEPIEARFWMKDTLIPLQVAFWDTAGDIVGLIEMTPCEADPCPTYGPERAFVGAVEANVGWFTAHGVAVGDTVELDAGTS
jgi:uncharacterized membrane protein (UPF0127 family)